MTMKKALQLFIILTVFMLSVGILSAATHVVTDNGNSGAGTLRQAISDASSGDEILFSFPNTSSTISISSELSINKNLTIDGSNLLGGGKYITIEQTGSYRVLNMSGNVTLENLIISGADASSNYGGGIFCNSSILTLDNITITSNKALSGAGIFMNNNSSATIRNSTITNNSIEENGTYDGAGIYASANCYLYIMNSLISGNSISSSQVTKGGGIYIDGADGNTSTLRIENSTIASNSISGNDTEYGAGIYIGDYVNASIVNATIYGNTAFAENAGAGIYTISDVNILNSVLVENKSNDNNDDDDIFIESCTARLYKCWYENHTLSGSGSIITPLCNTTAYTSCDLTGDALDYYGGYNNTLEVSSAGNNSSKAGTGTYAYYNETDGYYFKDASDDYRKISDNSTFTPSSEDPDEDKIIRDQRGYYRCEDVWYGDTPTNSTTHGITRGAYQYYGVVCNNNMDTDWTSSTNKYYTSIQGGINHDEQSSGDNLRLAGTAIYEEDIDLDKNIGIFSPDRSSIVRVYAPGVTNARVFNITGSTPELSRFTIMGGNITGSGGGIFVNSNTQLDLDNVKVIRSKASNDGGGICASVSSTVTISNSQFSGNEANSDGGAIYSDGILDINNSTLSFNEANFGGGLHLYYPSGPSPNTTIVNSTICNNSANNGGGIYIYSGVPVSIDFSTISNNSTSGSGGGILNFYGNPTIKNTLIGNNTASTGNDFHSAGGTITDNGYNIVENSSGFSWSATGDITGEQADLFGTGKANQQLFFNPRYTGHNPSTPTLKIENGSVAIEAGEYDSNVLSDQIGTTRDDPPTIGAYDIGISSICPSQVEFSDVGSDRFTVSWQSSDDTDSDGCCAFIKQTSDINDNASPVMGTSYNANTEYGLGDEIGSTGWYCFYNGNDIDPEITVTGLQVGKTYKVYAAEYDGPNVLYYCRSLTSQNPNTQLIPPDEVWYCEDYCESCANDGHSWQEDAFDNLTDARNAVKDGGTVHQACEQTTPVDDYDLDGKSVELGEFDFEMTGDLDVSNGGCILTNGSGHLVRTGSSPLLFPFCFNGYTFYVEVSWTDQGPLGSGYGSLNGDQQTIGARMNPDDYYGPYKSVIGAQWHLEGPDDLDATIKFMIPKAYIPNKSTLEHYLLSDQITSPLWREHDADVESGTGAYSDYWVITVENVDEF